MLLLFRFIADSLYSEGP